MTSGERMVWAAAFVQARFAHRDTLLAIRLAAVALHSLRIAMEHEPNIDEADRAMLYDMLSNGGDR